jgi:hypothetical protein
MRKQTMRGIRKGFSISGRAMPLMLAISLLCVARIGCTGIFNESIEVSVLQTPVPTTTPYWIQLKTQDNPSPTRKFYMMTYDSLRDKLVLFGGEIGINPLDDTWEFNGRSWSKIETAHRPPATTRGMLCYVKSWRKCILFGGQSTNGVYLNNTWSYDGMDWVKLETVGNPPGRRESGMVFDEHINKILLFGGGTYSDMMDETWTFDGRTWRQVFPEKQPSKREACGMAFDRTRQRTVVYGGYYSLLSLRDDTWEFDGVTWTEMSPPHKPVFRLLPAFCYYDLGSTCVLFGGWNIVSGYNVEFDDTWEYDGVDWRQIFPDNKPPKRFITSMQPFNNGNGLILYGGLSNSQNDPFNDTWVYSIVARDAPDLSVIAIVCCLALVTAVLIRKKFTQRSEEV